MSVIIPTITRPNIDTMLSIWSGVQSGDTCREAGDFHEYSDRSVHVYGTFDGGSISIDGTLDDSEYDTLNDTFGSPLTLSATASLRSINEYVNKIKPVPSGGGGSMSLTVVISAKRNRS